jgi:hypothetical protein
MTQSSVMEIIFGALKDSRDIRINDVTMENGDVILTTEPACDGGLKQVWVLSAAAIVETEPCAEDGY